jgi:flavodoxin
MQEGEIMKAIVIYFSLTGKTELVAKTAARIIGADIRKIEETSNRKSGPLTFIFGGFGAMLNAKSKIKPIDFNPANYDMVLIGSPVWGARPTPAVNEFVAETDFQGKEVFIICTSGGNGAGSAIKNLTQKIEKKSGKVVGSFSVVTSKVPDDDLISKTREEFRKYQGRKR